MKARKKTKTGRAKAKRLRDLPARSSRAVKAGASLGGATVANTLRNPAITVQTTGAGRIRL